MTVLVGMAGFAAALLLGMVLPRTIGTLLFCFFATGCVQCGAAGDPINAVVLLIEGTVIAWVMFEVGRMQRDAKVRTKAKKAPPEVMP